MKLFTMESLLLTLLGCGSGLLLIILIRYGINVANISYTPPNNVSPIQLLVDLDVRRIMFALVLMGVVSTLAAYLPAKRASNQKIIDALGHV